MFKLKLATLLITTTVGWQAYQATKPPPVDPAGRARTSITQAAQVERLKHDNRRLRMRDGQTAERLRRLAPAEHRPGALARALRGIGGLVKRIPLRR